MNCSTSFTTVWWSTFRHLLAILFLFLFWREFTITCGILVYIINTLGFFGYGFRLVFWLSEDLIRFLAITFLSRCCRIFHRRFCLELGSHTARQTRMCSLWYAARLHTDINALSRFLNTSEEFVAFKCDVPPRITIVLKFLE